MSLRACLPNCLNLVAISPVSTPCKDNRKKKSIPAYPHSLPAVVEHEHGDSSFHVTEKGNVAISASNE